MWFVFKFSVMNLIYSKLFQLNYNVNDGVNKNVVSTKVQTIFNEFVHWPVL
jgi:hypothetical protein